MRTRVIAEVASNHGGDIDFAEECIRQCADVGADIVKFQSYQVKHLNPADPQYDWLKRAELSDADHERLLRRCEKEGVQFLTTAFHEDRVPFLASLGIPAIKVGSGEARKSALIEAIVASPCELWASSGLATWPAEANVRFHCMSLYPTQLEQACLRLLVRPLDGARVGW